MLSDYNGKTEDEIVRYVRNVFGGDYALGGLISLKQLGLHEFPINPTHKIIKSEVRMAVMRHLSRGDEWG